MKNYIIIKRCLSGLIISSIITVMVFFFPFAGISEVRRFKLSQPVYDPVSRTCNNVYCHSNGKGVFRPIRWEKTTTQKVNCFTCHDSPPKDGNRHQKASLQICGQKCHTKTIKDGYTTYYHINGIIEGINQGGNNLNDIAEDCLLCHKEPQGAHLPILPSFKMLSNHVGGEPAKHDCIVCHMEDDYEFHKNGIVELKNHLGGTYFTLEQYNQFCLSCHDTGQSVLFGPIPFSTQRPIPNIHIELTLRSGQLLENVKFLYPHNHAATSGLEASQIMNQSGSNSLLQGGNPAMGNPAMGNPAMGNPAMGNSGAGITDMGNPAMTNMPSDNTMSSSTSTRRKMISDPTGGGNILLASAGMAGPVIGQMGASPLMGMASPLMLGAPAITSLSNPVMGGVGPSIVGGITPIMGGMGPILVDPVLAGPISSPMMGGGGIGPGGMIISPSAPIGGMGGGMGVPVIKMIGGVPGNMIMGAAILPSMGIGIGPMMGLGLFGGGMMPGPLMLHNPIMGMPGIGIFNMGGHGMMPPVMPVINMPWHMMEIMPGQNMNNPLMGYMPMPHMPPNMETNPMMPYMGGRNMPDNNMGNMDIHNNMQPSNQSYPNNNVNNNQTGQNQQNNQTGQNQQNNQQGQTAACLACHIYEDPSMLEFSVISNNFHGHFSHQNCIDCHRPHGSEYPGLLKPYINWNQQTRSCDVKFCHPTHIHKPPLTGTNIYYDIKPEITCNTYSCHIKSMH